MTNDQWHSPNADFVIRHSCFVISHSSAPPSEDQGRGFPVTS
jgi:hypothetical protein